MDFLTYLSCELNKYCLNVESSIDKKTGKPLLEDAFLASLTCARTLVSVIKKYGEMNPDLKHLAKSSIDGATMQLPSQYSDFVNGK